MQIEKRVVDNRNQCALAKIVGAQSQWTFRVAWRSKRYSAYPRDLRFCGVDFPYLKFGFGSPWTWRVDLAAHETAKGAAIMTQGYEEFGVGKLPFIRNRYFFFSDPELLYQEGEFHHYGRTTYTIAGIEPQWMSLHPQLDFASLHLNGVTIHWQFSPKPISGDLEQSPGECIFEFDSPKVEAVVMWSREATPHFPSFKSTTKTLSLERQGDPPHATPVETTDKSRCIDSADWISLPEGEAIVTGTAAIRGDAIRFKPGLWDLALRRVTGDTVELGMSRVFCLDRWAESREFPMLKPYLIRGLRSLRERMLFDVVPEDDPSEEYKWGTGTWPRCYSVLALDYFGLSEAAYGYLQFMLDISLQFEPLDGCRHLWDVFSISGAYWGDELYSIDSQGIKLYEAGKFYSNHREDRYGEALRTEHYHTLKDWCRWIECYMDSDGLILDATESNVWNVGFGSFSQAAAAAGVKLFSNIAQDGGHAEDAHYFSSLARKLVEALNCQLYSDAENSYLGIEPGIGDCYTTYIPCNARADGKGNRPNRIGLSCYSLAPSFFLQDPEVGILPPDDPKADQTLRLVLKHLGDPFDPRIVRWHVGPSHMGYGQGQLLMALLYTGRHDAFRERLQGLFDVSCREIGDPHLMQEVLNRAGMPNRGNKAHLTYYPLVIAYLIKRARDHGDLSFVSDLRLCGEAFS